MNRYQALKLADNPGEISIKIEEFPTPEPGPGEVLVRLTASRNVPNILSLLRTDNYCYIIPGCVTAIFL